MIALAESLVITHLVPFAIITLEGSNDRKIIIGALTFKSSKCKDKPETSNEFKSCIGK